MISVSLLILSACGGSDSPSNETSPPTNRPDHVTATDEARWPDIGDISVVGRYGWDAWLGVNCEVPAKGGLSYKDACDYLKNESIHNGCFWSGRNEEFQDLECLGKFSKEPPKTPITTPTPRPTNTPSSTPNDSVQTEIAGLRARLQHLGIELKLETRTLPPLPGELPYQRKAEIFAQVLLENFSLIEKHREKIRTLWLSQYTSDSWYENKYSLNLDVSLTRSDLLSFFRLWEQSVQLRSQSLVEFSFGIQLYQPSDLDLFAGFWEFQRTLKVSYQNPMEGLDSFLQILPKAAPFYVWADQQKLELRLGTEITKDLSHFVNLILVLQGNQKKLEEGIRKNALSTVQIETFVTKVESQYQTLYIPGKRTDYRTLERELQNLRWP